MALRTFSPEESGRSVGAIVPHAGWMFSGKIAAWVMAILAKSSRPSTVIIFGGHLGPASPSSIMASGAWETPLGPAEVDSTLARALMGKIKLMEEDPQRGGPDNTIEVQLPMVKHLFPDSKILPIFVAATEEGVAVGEVCGRLVRSIGIEVIVLGSTDLTHYGPGYGFAPAGPASQAEAWVREVSDRAIIEAITAMDAYGVLRMGLEHRNACCPGAASAAVACAKELGAKRAELVHYTTSLEIMEGEDFVGYAGVVFWV